MTAARRLGLLLALLLGAGLFGALATASAQEDPYGTTTTTTETPGEVPTCGLTLGKGVPGTTVTATVTNVPVGATVRILFDGDEVGRATADDVSANHAGASVIFNGRAVQSGATVTATVSIDFTVPVLAPGRYTVTAVGDTFSRPCGAGAGVDFEVLAASQGTDGGGGSLPRTGVYVGLFLVVAVALLFVGRGLLEASRRRARAARSTTTPRHRAPADR